MQEKKSKNRVQKHGLQLPKPNTKQIFSQGVQQKKWCERALHWAWSMTSPNRNEPKDWELCLEKSAKFEYLCAFFHDSSDYRCRSSTVDHRTGNRFWQWWPPETPIPPLILFASLSSLRISLQFLQILHLSL